MKILVSFLVVFSLYLYAADGISTNMDKKVYYDADRTIQDEFEVLSEELDLFINNEASDELIKQYKNGKPKEGEEDLEIAIDPKEAKDKTKVKSIEEEPGFFAKMLEKIGIGSTQKIIEEDTPTENKASKSDEPIEEATTKDVAEEEVVVKDPVTTEEVVEDAAQEIQEEVSQESTIEEVVEESKQDVQEEVSQEQIAEEPVVEEPKQEVQDEVVEEPTSQEPVESTIEETTVQEEVTQPNEILEEEVPNEN